MECVRKSIPDWEGKPFGEPKFLRFSILGLYLPSIEMLGYFDKECRDRQSLSENFLRAVFIRNVGAGETCPKILRANFIRPYRRRSLIVVDKPDATS